MGKKIFIIIVIALSAIFGLWKSNIWVKPAEKEEAPLRSRMDSQAGILLNNCTAKFLQAKFLCDFSWERVDTDNAVVYFLRKDPAVSFKLIRFNTEIRLIEQLNRIKLEEMGLYRDGFVIENTEVAGLKAIKVKALSKKEPIARVTDYYFVRDQALYAAMFSVSPKENWDKYKFPFQDMVNSLAFAESNDFSQSNEIDTNPSKN